MAQLDIFMYIKAYSEPIGYSGIVYSEPIGYPKPNSLFRTHSLSSTQQFIQNPKFIQAYSKSLRYLPSFRHYSRAIYAYSEPYLGRFRYI